jgi:predicted permease
MDDFGRDWRYAVRGLRRNPGVTGVAVLLLAIGIGASTSTFSVVNSVLFKPLPYPDSHALVRIVHAIGGIEQPYFSDAIYLTYLDNTQTFEGVGVWSPGETAAITGRGVPEEVSTLKASRGVLTTLAVRPEIGRWFSLADDTPGSPDTVILTSGYWRRRFGGDTGVLGRAITINGRPHQIIGVTPADFRFDSEFEIILPLRIDRAAPAIGFRLLGVARLKGGVTLTQANADASRILDILFQRPQGNPANRSRWAPVLKSLKQDVVGDIGGTLWLVMSAIGVVLVMACANIANLLLVRADARRSEIAIRAALGARWTRIARQFLMEGLVLALLGAVLGLALASVSLRALVALGPSNLPRLAEVSIDFTVLAFTMMIAVASGLVFAVAPILKYSTPRLSTALSMGRRAGITPERQRSQQVLVAGQLALALVLLVCAGLIVRSFQALRDVQPGFTQPDRVQTFTVSIPATMVPEPLRVTRMQQEVVDKLAGMPGVISVAFSTRLPMGSDRASSALLVEGHVDEGASSSRTPANRQVKVISPGVFRTLGTPLVAGRDFTWSDVYDVRNVAIVSANLARELWGSAEAALGRRVRERYDNRAPWREIVGVAGDIHDDGVHQSAPPTIYWPAQPIESLQSISAGYQGRRVTFAVRTGRAGTPQLLEEVREAVWSVSAALPVAQARTLQEMYDRSMARTSFTLVILAIAATTALLLGILGVYGVMSHAVAQRRREIGIRLALGAGAGEIRRLFLRRGFVLTTLGIAIGIGGAAMTTRVMRSLLFAVTPMDPVAFTMMPLILAAAAMLATYVPVRRALTVNPVEVIRTE